MLNVILFIQFKSTHFLWQFPTNKNEKKQWRIKLIWHLLGIIAYRLFFLEKSLLNWDSFFVVWLSLAAAFCCCIPVWFRKYLFCMLNSSSAFRHLNGKKWFGPFVIDRPFTQLFAFFALSNRTNDIILRRTAWDYVWGFVPIKNRWGSPANRIVIHCAESNIYIDLIGIYWFIDRLI